MYLSPPHAPSSIHCIGPFDSLVRLTVLVAAPNALFSDTYPYINKMHFSRTVSARTKVSLPPSPDPMHHRRLLSLRPERRRERARISFCAFLFLFYYFFRLFWPMVLLLLLLLFLPVLLLQFCYFFLLVHFFRMDVIFFPRWFFFLFHGFRYVLVYTFSFFRARFSISWKFIKLILAASFLLRAALYLRFPFFCFSRG